MKLLLVNSIEQLDIQLEPAHILYLKETLGVPLLGYATHDR